MLNDDAIRIGYVIKMYPRFSETFILNEVLELERQGMDLAIFSLKKPDDGCFHPAVGRVRTRALYLPEVTPGNFGQLMAAQTRIAKRAPGPWAGTLLSVLQRGWSPSWKHLLQAGWLAEQAPQARVGHLHAHFASAAARVAQLASRLSGISYSFTAHAKDIYQREAKMSHLREKIAGATFVVTVSDFNRQFLIEQAGAAYTDRIRRLYNGINLIQFQPPHLDERRDDLIVGVGRLVEKKGFTYLIEACRLLAHQGRNFECQIVGKGPQEAALLAQIQSAGLQDKVHLVGAQPQEAVVELYKQATLGVFPCIVAEDGNRDGLPTVLLEALACELPVVSTPITGIPEIVIDGVTGMLRPPGDAAALAEAIGQLFDDPALRARLGRQGRVHCKREFDIQMNGARLGSWFQETLAAQPMPALTGIGQEV